MQIDGKNDQVKKLHSACRKYFFSTFCSYNFYFLKWNPLRIFFWNCGQNVCLMNSGSFVVGEFMFRMKLPFDKTKDRKIPPRLAVACRFYMFYHIPMDSAAHGSLGPVHTGRGGARKCCKQKMGQIVANWSVHTALQTIASNTKGFASKFACKSAYACCVNEALHPMDVIMRFFTTHERADCREMQITTSQDLGWNMQWDLRIRARQLPLTTSLQWRSILAQKTSLCRKCQRESFQQ